MKSLQKKIKNTQRTFSGYFIKIKFKICHEKYLKCSSVLNTVFIYLVFISSLSVVSCNRPPRFLIDGQTEIVLRLKEGEETPVGKNIFVYW